MSFEVHKSRVRAALAPRAEPYWGPPLIPNRHLGYRKIDAQRGSWVARIYDPETRKLKYNRLGLESPTFGHDQAREAALAWFKSKDAGITDEAITAIKACEQYVEDRRREKGEACAHDAEMRFRRTVYDTSFGATAIKKLRTPAYKAWLDGLQIGKAAKKRTFTSLKAALNLAVENRQVGAELSREWSDVKPPQGADRRRDLFLDLGQRRALRDAAEGRVRDLIEAAMVTGARAGELVSAARGQFDARTGTMKFIGKTGSRTVPLSPAALALFARLAKSKLPTARLLVRDDGKPWAHSDWDELVRDAAAAAVVKDGKGNALKDEKGKEVKLPAGVCLYTLRHSFITQAITDGMSTLDVARMVGTSVAMIDKHYGHFVHDAARDRLAKVQLL